MAPWHKAWVRGAALDSFSTKVGKLDDRNVEELLAPT